MEGVIGLLAVKTCAAVVLALAAAATGRFAARHALAHALWIVVLLELLVPPLLEVGVLPRPGPFGGAESASPPVLAPAADSSTDAGAAPIPTAVGAVRNDAAPYVPFPRLLLAVWGSGTIAVLLLGAVRLRRFGGRVRTTSEPPVELVREARRVARRLGMSRCPPLRIVPARISPMVRPRLGSVEILFPSALLGQLRRRELAALVAHELAHVRRRDHWVRLLELAAGAVFWWHPLVWWARRRLHRVEEACCDGLVLDALPGHEREYATGLLKTVEFLAPARSGPVPLSTGAGGARILEERLTMIMKRTLPAKLSRPQRLALALAAGALLAVVPTWAERPGEDPGTAEPREPIDRQMEAAAEVRQDVLALERRAIELEEQLHEVRVRQQELQAELAREQHAVEIRRLEAEAEAEEAAGRRAEAERLRADQARVREHLEQEKLRARLEAERVREVESRASALRRLQLEAAENEARGDHRRAAELEQEMLALQLEIEEAAHRSQLRQMELERRAAEVELSRLREEVAARRDFEERKAQAEERHRELRLRDMRRRLAEMVAEQEALESHGRTDEAAELERRIDALRHRLEDEESDREF